MIKYFNDNRSIASFGQLDVFAVRIFSLFKTYGLDYPFAQFWAQEAEGRCTAVISALDGDFTLSYKPGADLEELEAFFHTAGFQSLQCDQSFSMGKPIETGIVFEKRNRNQSVIDAAELNIVSPCSLESVYKLNQLNQQKYDYQKWYADFSFRMRCGTSKPFAVLDGQAVASTASYTAIWEDNVLIGYIATAPAARGRSYASKLLQYMTAGTDKNYFILCRAALKPFYEKLGFHETGKWSLY